MTQAGETAVALDGRVAAVVFGAEAAGGSGRVEYGVDDALTISGETNVLFVTNEGPHVAHRGIYTGRLGIRQRHGKYLALRGGLGGGGSALGGFVGPDVGAIVAFENRAFVPFVGSNAALSVPFAVQSIDIPEQSDSATRERMHTTTTYYIDAQAGFRVPIRLSEATLSLLGAINLGVVGDSQRSRDALVGISTGLHLAM